MSDQVAVFHFVDEGRMAEPSQLADFIKSSRGRPIDIDMTDVPMMTSLHYQVYLAAAAEWAEEGTPFQIINTNDQFNACLALLGGQHEHCG